MNDAPVLTDLDGDAVSYQQGEGPIVIDQNAAATVGDVDSSDFDGGNLTVSIASGGAPSEDVLWVNHVGMSAGEIGFVAYTETVADDFDPATLDGNDGTQSWTNSWQELGESDGMGSGQVNLEDGGFEIWAHDDPPNGHGLSREVDLS